MLTGTRFQAGFFHGSIVLLLGLWFCAYPSFGEVVASADKPGKDLAEMSLEDLMQVQVTSVSKKQERGWDAAAAITVVTGDDIRRSGATSLAEALRLVPGLDVAKLDANKWAISVRGLNDRFANKLLVLIDGRTVYTPLFAGVFWEAQDVLLEDVDRIEVIRGPGGTMWGANAVNGVINVITKKAGETQGGVAVAGSGTEERGFGGFRYGGKLSDRSQYRLYLKYFDRDAGTLKSSEPGEDGWHVGQLGFRSDTAFSDDDTLTVQGDFYYGDSGSIFVLPSLWPPFKYEQAGGCLYSGENILARWEHRSSESSTTQLQVYYDQTRRRDMLSGHRNDTWDMDLQQRIELSDRHSVVWGVGWRFLRHVSQPTWYISLEPSTCDNWIASTFVQDEISLADNRLRLTIGSKFEYNDYSEFEAQPNVRLAWLPNEKHTVWAAVSRAVRTPSRSERDVRLNAIGAPFLLGSNFGNPDLKTEELLAYEIGYRVNPLKHITFDLTAFYNQYDKLRTIELSTPFLELLPLPPHLVLPFIGANNMEAESYGAELAVEWQPVSSCRVRAWYSRLMIRTGLHAKGLDIVSETGADSAPQSQFGLRISADLRKDLELDAVLRYVDAIPSLHVDAYPSLDLRLGWHPNDALEIAVVGQSLLRNQHGEFTPSLVTTVSAEVDRGVYGEITWRF